MLTKKESEFIPISKEEYFVGFATNEYKILSLRAKIRDIMEPYVIEFISKKEPFKFKIKFNGGLQQSVNECVETLNNFKKIGYV